MLINIANVILLLTLAFKNETNWQYPINDAEKELSSHIENLIRDHAMTSVIVDTHTTLELDENEYWDPMYTADEDYHNDVPDENTCPPEYFLLDLEYKKRAVTYWKSGKRKHRTFESVQNKYKKLKTLTELYRWETEIEKNGTRFDKLHAISLFVRNKFLKSRDEGLPVHDNDLRKWGLKASQELHLNSFTASKKWVDNFKKKIHVVSRKVTNFKTVASSNSEKDLNRTIYNFVNLVKREITKFDSSNTYNSDQSGFNMEMHSGRTLSHIGEKKTEAIVQSLSSTTHSYTIQIIISATGKLLSPLFINLNEIKGYFGDRVQRNMFRASNLYITASKSGKLTKEHVINWTTQVYFPHVGNNSLLLLDAWRGQCEQTILANKPLDKNVSLQVIPEGTTKFIQPLDVFTFRQWKDFVRKFSDSVLIHEYDIILHLRNNILKLQSLVHNQFSAPRYINMFRYAWYKSGYLDEHPGEFKTPANYSFSANENIYCDICQGIAFIRCGWCNKTLCFKHFFSDYHYHEQDSK